MRKADSARGLLNQELAAVEWSQKNTLAVLRAAENGGQPVMKKKMSMALAMALALMLLTTGALAAAGLLFSPRYDALQLANQALEAEYGVTAAMQPALLHTVKEADGMTIVVYEIVDSAIMTENRFGAYVVAVRDGKADASWTMDGMDTSGGLDAPAWGAEQLAMYVQDWGSVYSYMESHGMLTSLTLPDDAVLQQRIAETEQIKAEALAMAQLTIDQADEIGRAVVAALYALSDEQTAQLERFNGENGFGDESTYDIVDGRPLINLYFHLTQQPGEWQEKDGIYVVTLSLLDGAVEDIFYDNGLMGNG